MAAKETPPSVTEFVSSFKRKPPAAQPDTPTADVPQPVELTEAPATEVATESPVAQPVAAAPATEPTDRQTGKKETASPEHVSKINYAETFLGPVRVRKTKAVYLNEDTHTALTAIIQASEALPMADLIINIIHHHFETYGPDIRAFIAEQEKKNKKRLPF